MFFHLSNSNNKKEFGDILGYAKSERNMDMKFDEAFESGFIKDYVDSLIWFSLKDDKDLFIACLADWSHQPHEETIKYLKSNPMLRFQDNSKK